MEKRLLLILAVTLVVSFNSFSQLNINSLGKVGINNTSPSYQLDVEGNFRISNYGDGIIFENSALYPYGWSSLGNSSDMWYALYAEQAYFYNDPYIMSDAKIKTNVINLESSKSKLLAMRPVKYFVLSRERTGEKKEDKNQTKGNSQIGFIAQEIQELFPEVVGENSEGVLGIRYSALIPILVKAIQEQQVEIDELKTKIERLKSAN